MTEYVLEKQTNLSDLTTRLSVSPSIHTYYTLPEALFEFALKNYLLYLTYNPVLIFMQVC